MSQVSKLLFVHDHVFVKDGDSVYSTGCFPAEVWDRYLNVFYHVTVLARSKQQSQANQKLTPTMRDNVTFTFTEDASNLKALFGRNQVLNQAVKEQVSQSDAVIARLSSELGLLAIAEARKQGKPYAIELVDCPFDSYWNYGSLKAKLYAPIIFARVHQAVKRAPFVLYVTEQFLQNRYPNKQGATVACSNVNILRPLDQVLNERISKIQAGEPRSFVKIGQIASLTGTFKGIHNAIEAVAQANKAGINMHYHVLGAGDPSPHLEVAKQFQIAEKIHFDGVRSSGQAVYEWLDDLDVYIHPSLKEGLPRAVIEAMSRACPVVASSVAGTPELLANDCLVKPGDSRELSTKLIAMAESSERMEKASRDNFETSKRYTCDDLNMRRTKFWEEFKLFAQQAV